MPFAVFLLQTIVISLSGVMAPGPVTAVAVSHGVRSAHAGALIAIGHGIVEAPLMLSLYWGLGFLFGNPVLQGTVSLIGGLLLCFMGYGLLSAVRTGAATGRSFSRSSLMAGVLLSVANPYFLLWWLSIGTALMLRSAGYGLWALVAFGLVHWLCDFFWYYFLSAVSYHGGRRIGTVLQKWLFVLCGVLLFIFGGAFMYDGVVTAWGLL